MSEGGTIPPVASLATDEEAYLPSDLDPLTSLDLDDDFLADIPNPAEARDTEPGKTLSKREMREERMRRAFERSRGRYNPEGAYTEAGWFAGLRFHPHDFDTLKDDKASVKDQQGGKASSGTADLIVPQPARERTETKLELRMVEHNLANLYHKRLHLSCLSVILPLLQISIPQPLRPLLRSALALAYPFEASLANIERLEEELIVVGKEEVGIKDTQVMKGLVEIGLRSGLRILATAKGSPRPREINSTTPAREMADREGLGTLFQAEDDIQELEVVLREVANRGRVMGRKPGQGALAEAAGKMYAALNDHIPATVCFLAAIADRGLCQSYLTGLKSSLSASWHELEPPPAGPGEEDNEAETRATAGPILKANIDYLVNGNRAEGSPLFCPHTVTEEAVCHDPPAQLTTELADSLSRTLLLTPTVHQADKYQTISRDKDEIIVKKACERIARGVAYLVARQGDGGPGEHEEADGSRSVRTL